MTINCTHAYFNSRKKLETINITKNHNITLNANGGYFNRNNNVKVINNQITLPLPNRTGYTFNVYINNQLVANSVTDWCQNVDYGSSVRVVANASAGTNTSYDQTMTVGTGSLEFKPSW